MPTKHLWSGGLKGGVKACWSGCVRSREAEEAGVHEVSQEGFQKERRELRTNLREGREEVVQGRWGSWEHVVTGRDRGHLSRSIYLTLPNKEKPSSKAMNKGKANSTIFPVISCTSPHSLRRAT